MKDLWKAFKSHEPGERFEKMYLAHKASDVSFIARFGYLALGLVLLVVGIIALPAPGPGTLVIAFALALLARESITLARALDRFELKLRALWTRWKNRNRVETHS